VDGVQFIPFGLCMFIPALFFLRFTTSSDCYFGMNVMYLLTKGANV